MSTTNLQIGVAAGLLLGLAAPLIVQYRTNADLAGKIQGLREAQREILQLRGENEQLAGHAAEVTALRSDDVELARLQGEASALQQRRAAEAHAAATVRWQKTRSTLVDLLARYGESHPAVVAQRAKLAALGAGLGLPPEDVTIFNPNQLDQPLAMKSSARPLYPFELRRAETPGEVVVSFVVGSNGDVIGARADKSTQPEFEPAAVDAIKQWKFSPGQRAGLPVNVRVQMPIVFTLGNALATPGWFR